MNYLIETTSLIMGIIIGFVVGATIGLLIMYLIVKPSNDVDVPNEHTEVIDSLTKVNDSIKIKIEKLDSIKDAKIIEVSTLDNDSTLKLFYKLVSE